ncbi:type 1 glutamine amidotransferase domain-containing protein [Erythrobacter sp. F6033]|uniref:type 1 glutamine amidotransferase domain-containing protein n=1 Tax=Erythrobacter sp. F6033 TaxID=2926401 RepID=UPI001FF58C6D|nr:type 1 glutamine amidotransferase domain-containing protein [Erythrobacter sp. F6033]MCK0128925.1 type 1 glutamine amidotransferase [Erythrobacter sp. F6033]
MKRILIIATDGFEQSELMEPKARLEEDGADITIASLEDGEITGWKDSNWGESVPVDITVEEVSSGDYDALLLPGGQINPDILRMNETVINLIKDFDKADKPIAAICHAPWLLAEADIVKGKVVTSWPSLRTDLRNAGADVVDREVAVDGNLITSRNPEDIPAFTAALKDAMAMERIPENA